MVDLFRVSANVEAMARGLAELWTPDENGRIYVGEGPVTARFEGDDQHRGVFGTMTGLDPQDRILGVNSCTAAIDLALMLIGVGPGDEVICSPINCTASNGSVVTRGARIVWADVDPLTGNIDPASVARVIGPRTKAVIAVDWAGRSCDYGKLHEVSRLAAAVDGSRTIPIIEDAAHCLYLGQDRGDFVCWSFGPIKFLTTGGYGGALLPPPALYERARLLRWHGLDRRSKEDFRCSQDIKEVGLRAHMTDDMATIGLCNLPLAIHAVERARENAAWYHGRLAGVPGITVPPFDQDCNYWIYTILAEDRDDLSQTLTKWHIGNSQVHARNDRHSGFRTATAAQDGRLPGVQQFDEHQLSIPVGWWVTRPEQELVVDAIIRWSRTCFPDRHVEADPRPNPVAALLA